MKEWTKLDFASTSRTAEDRTRKSQASFQIIYSYVRLAEHKT